MAGPLGWVPILQGGEAANGGCEWRLAQCAVAGMGLPGGALPRLHGYAGFCQTHQSSAKGLDSSMVAPFSPASLATCNRAVLSAQDQSAGQWGCTPSNSSGIHTHLTECCRPTPSIILSGNTQGQHIFGWLLGARSGLSFAGALLSWAAYANKHMLECI